MTLAFDITAPTPAGILRIREDLGMTQLQFGELLGVADAARTVRAWEFGTRNGRAYSPSGSALAALRYVQTILSAIEALDDCDTARARKTLKEALPKVLR